MVAFLDVSGAFNKTKIATLTQKMHEIGIPDYMTNWTSLYYTNKKLDDGFNQVTSSIGVDQGGILSPTLFNIYTFAVHEIENLSIQVTSYADDFSCYVRAPTRQECLDKLSINVRLLELELEQLNLPLNYNKTKFVDFSKRRTYAITENNIPLNYGNMQQVTSWKYLGVELEQQRTGISHTRQVKHRILSDLNALKFLRGTSWGNASITQLNLYKSVILPKIEYGAFAYFFMSSAISKNLQKSQNQVLRQVLGAVKTTPINSLHAVSGVLPLQHHMRVVVHRQLLQLCIGSSLFRTQIHSLGLALEERCPLRLGDWREVISEVGGALGDRRIHCPDDLEIRKRIEEDLSGMFIPEIPGVKKSSNPQHEEVRQRVLEFMSRKFPNYLQIWSDGAKNPEGVASASFCAGTDCGGEGRKLQTESSVYWSEIRGLTLAATHATTMHPPNSNIVIITDSRSTLSALKSLKQGDTTPPHLICLRNELLKLKTMTNDAKIVWNPSHVGLMHDRTADRLATLTTRLGRIEHTEELWHLDELRRFRRSMEERWRREYLEAQGAGSWTRGIIQNPLANPWFRSHFGSVRNITLAQRLVLGHDARGLLRFRLRFASEFHCPLCGQHEDNMPHIITECRETAALIERFLEEEGKQNLDESREERVKGMLRRAIEDPDLLLKFTSRLREANLNW